MSEQDTTATEATPQAEANPAEGEFKLNKTSEIADRFRGDHIIRFRRPVAVKGDIEATLASLREFVHPDADFATVLVHTFNGSGRDIQVQKRIKDALAPGAVEDGVSLDDALAAAQTVASTWLLGEPRAAKTSTKREGKVAQAEAGRAKAVDTALKMYRALSKAQRKQYRQTLLDMGSVTEEQIDAIDSEA